MATTSPGGMFIGLDVARGGDGTPGLGRYGQYVLHQQVSSEIINWHRHVLLNYTINA